MTVTATNRKNNFITNGVTVDFTFTFAITNIQQVNAITILNGVETPYTNFTVVQSPSTEGGTLTTNDVLDGVELLIYRDTSLTQQVDYQDGGRFPADSHEQALDKLTLQNQDQQDDLNRSLKTKIGDDSNYEVGNLESGKLVQVVGNELTTNGSQDTTGYTDIQAIARSLNVPFSAVIYSTDTTRNLDDVQYIYDNSNETVWSKPSGVQAGDVIVSVLGDQLEVTSGTYTMYKASDVNPYTMTLAQARENVFARIGDNKEISDRASGKFEYVSGETPNTFSIIQHDTLPLQLKLKTDSGWSLNAMGLSDNSAADQTADFNAMMVIIPAGSSITINKGDYIIRGGIATGHSYTTITGLGDVTFSHIVEGDTGRTSPFFNLSVESSTKPKVKNLKFSGHHIDASGGDNTTQGGLEFKDCIRGVGVLCDSFNMLRGFRANSSDLTTFALCNGKQAFNNFIADNGSTDTTFIECVSESAHYAPDAAGTPADPKSAGYGFLSDNSTRTKMLDSKSFNSGSDGFRLSGTTSKGGRVDNCECMSDKRYSVSVRDSDAEDQVVTNIEVNDIGNPTYWNGGPGSYTEAVTSVVGVYVNSPDTEVSHIVIKGTGDPILSTLVTGVHVFAPGDRTSVTDVTVNMALSNAGVAVDAGADGVTVRNNDVLMQVLTTQSEASYPYKIDGANALIEGNKAFGGRDGIFVTGVGADIKDNRSLSSARHGYNLLGDNAFLDSNRAIDSNAAPGSSAGYNLFGKDINCGTNFVIETTPSQITYSAWISSNATGLYEGSLVNRGSATLRDDLGAAGRVSTVFGKGVAATDIATLLTSLRSAGLIQT